MSERKLADKLGHIDVALDGGSDVPGARPGALFFEALRFLPATLPEVDLGAIDLSLTFLGKKIAAPLMISPMTGGVAKGGELNRRMAWAAEQLKIPFGVGSQRVALEAPERAKDFEIRSVAPTIPVFANLGAIQLVKGYGADHAWRAVEMIQADALYLHLNAMQEVVQEGGDVSWVGVSRAIEALCTSFQKRSGVPVYAREVGFGVPADQAQKLIELGVAGIDCAGGGGTSWTLVEGRVAKSGLNQALGRTLAAWGLTTPESILEVRKVTTCPLIASGGVKNGLDVARAVALGATVAGMAAPVLRAAVEGEAALMGLLEQTVAELRATLFGVGAPDLAHFRARPRLMRAP